MFRLILALALGQFFALSQNLPAFNWIKEVGGTGTDTFAALTTDPQGNIYLTGSTSSPDFPVNSAAQGSLASAGLYRIAGSSYTSLGQNNVTSIAVDPQNSSVIYIASAYAGLKSIDGGNTWTPLPIPSSISTLLVDPFNDQNLFAAGSQAIFSSTDAGATWAPLSTSFNFTCGVTGLWADPDFQGVLFAAACGNLVRSADSGATWQPVSTLPAPSPRLDFEPSLPGVIFIITEGAFVSTDDGQTFQQISIRSSFNSVVVDPNQPGRLLGANGLGIFSSTDNGATWTQVSSLAPLLLIPAGSVLYAGMNGSVYQLSPNLEPGAAIGPPGLPVIGAYAYSNGTLYLGTNGGTDVFVAKLDPSGDVIYSTFFGGSNSDYPIAIAVDPSGGVYVTGRTQSPDFPVTIGAYLTSDPDSAQWVPFLFKLNPDGSLAYSTYFDMSSTPVALAVDSTGSAYLTGTDNGSLPTTPGAYQTAYCCPQEPSLFFTIITNEPFLTKFDPTGATLLYSTYLGQYGPGGSAVAVAPDGTAYVAGNPSPGASSGGVARMNPTGSAILASLTTPGFNAHAIAIGPAGNVYLGGGSAAGSAFQPTPNAFQTAPPAIPPGSPATITIGAPGALIKMDAQLQNVLAATYLADAWGNPIQSIAVDASGNAYVSGATAPYGLPTLDELAEAEGPIGAATGFLAEISGDFSTLLFSTYLGDTQAFDAASVALSTAGSVIIGGSTSTPANVYLNSIAIPAPPALRIDSVLNAATQLGGPVSPGEIVSVNGAGFNAQSQLLINGSAVPQISQSVTQIVAAVPMSIAPGGALIQVENAAPASNPPFSNQVVLIVTPSH